MALYTYQAFNKEGKKIKGTIDAPSIVSVRDYLAKMSLYPITIELSLEKGKEAWWHDLFARSVSIKDKILFTKQLAVLLRSGIPLLEVLELLVDQTQGRLKSIIISIKDGLKEGQSFTQGLARYPKIFDTTYVQLVRAGEATGRLEVILERLTQYLERREEVNKRVSSALMYPLIQLAVIALVVIFLMTVVVPKMALTFQRQGKALPSATRIIVGISDFLTHYYGIVLIILFLVIGGLRYWRSTAAGARTFDNLKLKLPVIKYFARMGAVVQFSRTLGMLVEGGVNLAESLDIVVNIIDNQILAQALSQARDNIIKQGKIAQFLKQTDIFPPIAIHLIKTGEESGKLDTMLLTVAQNYETELNELADGLSATLQPVMLIVMAFVVGFIVLSIAQPLMEQASLAAF
jgi:type II secretory pathway component PulF